MCVIYVPDGYFQDFFDFIPVQTTFDFEFSTFEPARPLLIGCVV